MRDESSRASCEGGESLGLPVRSERGLEQAVREGRGAGLAEKGKGCSGLTEKDGRPLDFLRGKWNPTLVEKEGKGPGNGITGNSKCS